MADADPKLHEAIGFFEQMLQTMPGDRTSLEFLSVAYDQTGQNEKRRECLIRLADTLLLEKDYDNAQVIAGYLSAFMDYPPALAAVERVAEQIQGQVLEGATRREMQGVRGTVTMPGQTASVSYDASADVHALSHSAAAAEMDLVWIWKDREYLPKEACMDVMHFLTDLPVTDCPVLISAFALLDEKHPEWTERLMETMQRASELPPIPIELFEVQPAAAKLLPSAVVQIKGVLPFALLGDEVLVALLNPLSKELQDEVAARVNKKCHFFLAYPKAWRIAAGKLV